MLVDDAEDKFIEILEGTRAHTANVDNYIGRIITALDDDLNTQFYKPTFRHIRDTGRYWDVQFGQIETTSILTNNRTFAKASPQAQMEFDLPKRDILISEAFESAAAAYQDYGALLQDPTFLSLSKLYSGQPTSAVYGGGMPNPLVRDVLPGLPSSTNEQLLIQEGATAPDFPSALEALIPDPAIYKFETGTGFEIRPVIQPDGQAVVFHLHYEHSVNIREPVRADEKHLGRIKRHYLDTDVQLANFELRTVGEYSVALKASRTARGVPLLEDVPVAGVLFRPLPQQESSLQQSLVLAQTTIFPTLFDLMGLRWAPAIADLGPMQLQELDFVTQGRRRELQQRVFDYSSQQVDEFLRVPAADRRPDLYRPQEPVPRQHPNTYNGPGLNLEQMVPAQPVPPAPNGPMLPDMSPLLPKRVMQPPSPGIFPEPFETMPMTPDDMPQRAPLYRPDPPLSAPLPAAQRSDIELQSYRTASSAKGQSRSASTPAPSRPVPRETPQRLPAPEVPPAGGKKARLPTLAVPVKPVVRSQNSSDNSTLIDDPDQSENPQRNRWRIPFWKPNRP